ncbi:hypothetical protein AAXE64_07680 [Priestia megaterium]
MAYHVIKINTYSNGKMKERLIETVTHKEDADLIAKHCEKLHTGSSYVVREANEDDRKTFVKETYSHMGFFDRVMEYENIKMLLNEIEEKGIKQDDTEKIVGYITHLKDILIENEIVEKST